MSSKGFKETEIGLIPEDWKIIDFKDILKIRSEKSNDEEITKYSITNTGIHKRDEQFNKQLAKSTSKFKIIYKNDLVFGMSREILNFGVMKDEIGGVSSAYNVFKIDDSIDPRYLELFIRNWPEYFKDIIKPASREGQGIDKGILLTKQFYLPTPEYLQNFFYVYDSLNEKIRICHQMNQTLESIGQAIFQHWFVYFEFPDVEGRPYKSNGGEMVDSDLGEIPVEWNHSRVDDYPIYIIDGDRSSNYPKRKELLEDGDYPFISTKNFKNNRLDFSDVSFVPKIKFDLIKKGKVEENDIIMTTRGSVGNIALFENLNFKSAIINAQMLIIRPKEKFYSRYLYYLFTSKNLQNQFKVFSSGSAQPQLPINHLKDIKILDPHEDIIKKFDLVINKLNEQIGVNNQSISTLSKIRDLLLPKLMSGKIRVNIPEEDTVK